MRRAPMLALALLLSAVAAQAEVPAAWSEFDYRRIADQNRYLVRGAEAKRPARNMEPRMTHPDQIQETIDRLQSKGFCASGAAASCPTCKIDAAREKSCKKPNLLIFIVDDMGWGDFGAYGGGVTRGSATPMVDRLAAEGLMLTSTYAQPTCSPTRATVHTGQLPVHHGVLYPPMYGDPGGVTQESITLPYLLKQQGYRTQGVGKWHMGENKPNLPQVVGYDDYYGFLSVSDMYTEWRDQYYNPEVVRDEVRTTYMDNNHFSHYLIHATPEKGCEAISEITLPWEAEALQGVPNRGNANNCTPPTPNNKKVSSAQLDHLWAEYSESFIRNQAQSSQPWFLYHATRGCHFDNYNNVGDRRLSYARTLYSDCTVEMDEILGRLIRALYETGQADDTFVFFTSDNGPEDEIPPHGFTPFRGGKGDTWEGGVRVPGIAWWPGIVEPGRRSDGLFDLADLYTTFITLAGFDYAKASQYKDRYLYGIDQSSFLLTKDGESNRRSVLNWYLTNFGAVRMDEFKAHRMVTLPIGLEQGYFGGLAGVNLPVSYLWLFNLQADPKEKENINIRHLWAQHLFSGEFTRFMCDLVSYPPNLPTQPMHELMAQQQIMLLKGHPESWKDACGGNIERTPK
ncbi:MAG TPA: sulfatase-like hydrolase/transferase [Thermoanaerobaculia bacterium]|nr:sulfatase-like hydrolase/transferase [Thermoanaerobaculia bacterium]